ncbi:MAG: Do family serine endopeptidase [Elusimicrobia bacterium]|nr:Do family serine endopeptidase [Elusimicrobiota bacterium]
MKRFFTTIVLLAVFAGFYFYFGRTSREAIEAVPASVSNDDGTSARFLQEFEKEFTKVVERAKPAVCNISASSIVEMKEPLYFEDFFFNPFEDFFGAPRQPRYRKRKFKSEATGSGVIIDKDGYVLTNEHVIDGADEIKVTVYIGGKEKVYPAEIIGKDEQTDLAVIKIKSKKKFPFLPMGDSSSIKIGQFVFAIGSPFGLAQTVTYGIVSAERQSVRIQDKIYDDMIQTDAAINRGNSGGPLINLRGEVIGINTAIVAPSGGFIGVGFAIPVNKAKEILSSLIEKGEVTRGWLGIEMREVDEVIEKQFGLKSEEGVLVNRVIQGSPADEAGIKRGDVIVEYDGRPVKTPMDLKKFVQGTSPGEKVQIAVVRSKRNVSLTVKIGRLGGAKAQKVSEYSWKGITVKNIKDRSKYELPEGKTGVVVTSIDYSKPLASSGLIVGDIICGINRMEVASVSDFIKATKKVKIKDGVIFDCIRGGVPLYITFLP